MWNYECDICGYQGYAECETMDAADKRGADHVMEKHGVGYYVYEV